MKANLEILTKSSQLSIEGAEYQLGNKVVKVLEHLTAKKQLALGLVKKTAGVQVIYKLELDGKPLTLKGAPFSNWCKNNGVEISGKTGDGERTPKTFQEVFTELESYAKTEAEKLAYKLMKEQIAEAEKQIAEAEAEAKEIAERKEWERLNAIYGKKQTKKTK